MAKKKDCRYPWCDNYQRGTDAYCTEGCRVDHEDYKELKRRRKIKRIQPLLRVLCCGDRKWKNRKAIRRELLEIKDRIEFIVEGECATGADIMCREEGWRLKKPVIGIPANWLYQQRSAGSIRNRYMLKFLKPNFVLAFHADIENSKGTKDMIAAAKKAGIKVKLVEG